MFISHFVIRDAATLTKLADMAVARPWLASTHGVIVAEGGGADVLPTRLSDN